MFIDTYIIKDIIEFIILNFVSSFLIPFQISIKVYLNKLVGLYFMSCKAKK